MKIVVTGGAGFIGGNLVARLAAMNESEILVIDNLRRPCEAYAAWPENVRLERIDVRDAAAVNAAVARSAIVYHLAAQSNVMGSVYDAEYAFGANVIGTFNLLQAAKAAAVKRVVFTSSREVYGDPETLPVPESAPIQPKNGYGASKAAGEIYCGLAAAEGLQTTIVRLANVYGPHDRDRVIPLFLGAALAGEPLTLYGGDQVLDFIWIDTVVDALVQAAFGAWTPGPVNIGSGTGVTVMELAQRVLRITGSASPIRTVARRHQEVSRFVADIRRATQLFALQPPVDSLSHLPELIRPAFPQVATSI
jgi:UDP-glucose 4-epimerase